MPIDQRELERTVKAIHKAQTAQEPATNIISLLETLKKDETPTEEMLRTTRAGLIIGKLRAYPNKDVQRMAGELVNRWKKAVEMAKKSKPGSSSLAKGSASPAPKPSSPAPKPGSGASKKPFEGNPEKRTFKEDKVDISRTGTKTRDNCVGLMYNGLAYRSREPEDVVLSRAVEVENAAFKAFSGETEAYRRKLRSLFQNLKNKSNSELRENVLSGSISVDRFVVMTDVELQSPAQRKADAAFEEENMKKAQVPMVEKSISDTFECSGCKKKMVSYTQAQTRAADEPMTTFCECMNCGKRWKFS